LFAFVVLTGSTNWKILISVLNFEGFWCSEKLDDYCLWHSIVVNWCECCVCQLQALLDDVRRETEMLRNQLNNERATKQGLEGLLQDNHTKGWQTQMTIQERETEIQLLKDRLALNESKMYVHVMLTVTCRVMYRSYIQTLFKQYTSGR